MIFRIYLKDHDVLKKCLLSLNDFQNSTFLNTKEYMKQCCITIKKRRKTMIPTFFCNICKQTISNKQSHINQAFKKTWMFKYC